MYNYKVSVEQYKPFIKDLIKFYYDDLDNGTGGNLHIVLDDGNIENIQDCKEWCEEAGDSFGFFLCRVLEQFTEDELDKMYNEGWWGMGGKKREGEKNIVVEYLLNGKPIKTEQYLFGRLRAINEWLVLDSTHYRVDSQDLYGSTDKDEPQRYVVNLRLETAKDKLLNFL